MRSSTFWSGSLPGLTTKRRSAAGPALTRPDGLPSRLSAEALRDRAKVAGSPQSLQNNSPLGERS
jgi:hypothetical protein